MNTLLASILIATIVATSSAIYDKAMAVNSDAAWDSLVMPVADKCGINRYRGPDGVCHRKYYFGYGPKQFYGVCGGVKAHRVCNLFGQCWMVCD
jgi:hypothetical protein